MVRNKLRGDGITDDKTMIMERVIVLVADLPHQSRLREELTNTFLNELWNSLKHPPLLYVGDEFKYRSADGSNNVRQPAACPLARFALTIRRTQFFQSSALLDPPTRGLAAPETFPWGPSQTPSRCMRA